MANITRIDSANIVHFSDLNIGDYFFFYLHRSNTDIPLYLVISRDESYVGFLNVETNEIRRMGIEHSSELVRLPDNAVSITWFNPLIKG